MPFASEFTPELDDALLRRLTGQAERRGAGARGAASREALNRGISGDPWEGSARGIADQGTRDLIADLEADFGYRRAGLQREERLLGEGRQFQRGEREASQMFASQEAEKDRLLRRYLGDRGYEADREARGDAFTNSLIGAGGRVAGGYLAGLRGSSGDMLGLGKALYGF